MKNWYLLMTKPKEDAYAEQHLLNQDYEVYRPLAQRQRKQRGKMVTVTESLFPRYIFIRLDPETSNWSSVRYTRGVSCFVRFGPMPQTVPDHLIQFILDNETVTQQHIIDLDAFKQNQKIRINNDLFQNIEGIFDCYDGEQRALVLVEMMGKKTKIPVSICDLDDST